jgi:hypothetical protein
MQFFNQLFKSHQILFYAILSVIPVIILILFGARLIKRYDRRIQGINGLRSIPTIDENLNKILNETSNQEEYLKEIKENITQTIRQRNLVSKIKLEVQSYDEIVKSVHRVFESDISLLSERASELDEEINLLNKYSDLHNRKGSEFINQLLEQKKDLLKQIRFSISEIILSAQTHNQEKYIESIDRIEYNSNALANYFRYLLFICRNN